MTIFVDSHEPMDLQLLMQQSHPCLRQDLNQMGFADYLWHTWDGHTTQRERKQAGELMTSLDHVEEQLHRQIELGVADDHGLIVEGMLGPSATGTVAYSMSKTGKVMYQTGTFKRPYRAVMAWFTGLQRAGVTIHMVPDWKATAILVTTLHDNDQKEEHSTFQRHIKVAPPPIMEYNPYVLTLMGVHNGGAGEEIGKALIEKFKTPIEVFIQREGTLADVRMESGRRVGPSKARQLLKAIGRDI